jgi:energy-coupling factor transport system permease protein
MSGPRANEFEFIRDLPFGPYVAVNSPFHRLDPRTRILMVIIFMTAFILANRPVGLIFGIGVILAGWKVARVSIRPFWRGWRAALPFLLILAGLQVLFRTGSAGETLLLSFGWLQITDIDLWFGLALLLRFSGMMAVLSLAACTLSETEMTTGLGALLKPLDSLHIPSHDFVMVIQVTLRYFPLLSQAAERVAKAQASRGADWQPTGWNLIRRARQIIPLIVPLFVVSLRRAETLALAMDARGYGVLPVRTSMITLRYRPNDWLTYLGSLIVAVAIIFL